MAEMNDVVASETIEVEWGNAIRDRTVQRYDNVSTRTSENPSPTAGDVAFMQDSGDLDVYFSGAWRHVGSPVGTVEMQAGATVPPGWLACNGQAVSRTTYAALFTYIGTAWGAGDGSTTFNVPDFRGRYPRGVAASGTGDDLAESFGADTLPNHLHSITHTHQVDPPSTSSSSNGAHTHGGVTGTAQNASGGNNYTLTGSEHAHSIGSDGGHTHTVNVSPFNSGGSSAANSGNPTSSPAILPASLAINFRIKT